MKTSALALSALAAAGLLGISNVAQAHKAWLLPSQTVLSKDGWITIDAAVSNDLFYFNHNPLRLDNLVVLAPDGSKLAPQNAGGGKYRNTFDLQLTQPGTYKIAIVNDSLNASYELDGKMQRWRGNAADFAKQVPANAAKLEVRHTQGRVETFVTSGQPTDKVLQPTGKGLELVPVTHPNDLFAGEEAKFRFVLDGAPVAGVAIEVVPGGSRYRDKQNEVQLQTDAKGEFALTWPEPGMYWLEATFADAKSSVPQAKERRASYVATFEVLQQ